MKRHAGTFPAVPVLQGLIVIHAASWAPHGKINGCNKSILRSNMSQDFLVFLESELLCIIYRYDQWHFNSRELPQQLKSRETR